MSKSDMQRGFVTCSLEGVIVSCSDAACKAFGYQSMIGISINALMPSPFAEQHDLFLKRRIGRVGRRKKRDSKGEKQLLRH